MRSAWKGRREFSSWREQFHATQLESVVEHEGWISAAVSRSMTFIGPPHLGQPIKNRQRLWYGRKCMFFGKRFLCRTQQLEA